MSPTFHSGCRRQARHPSASPKRLIICIRAECVIRFSQKGCIRLCPRSLQKRRSVQNSGRALPGYAHSHCSHMPREGKAAIGIRCRGDGWTAAPACGATPEPAGTSRTMPYQRARASSRAQTSSSRVAQLVQRRTIVWSASPFSQKSYPTRSPRRGRSASATMAKLWFVGDP